MSRIGSPLVNSPAAVEEALASEALDREPAEPIPAAEGSLWIFLLPLLAAVAWLLTGPGAESSSLWALVTDAALNIGGLVILFLVLFWLQDPPGG
jgi:low affinity Fe/Cu permease